MDHNKMGNNITTFSDVYHIFQRLFKKKFRILCI